MLPTSPTPSNLAVLGPRYAGIERYAEYDVRLNPYGYLPSPTIGEGRGNVHHLSHSQRVVMLFFLALLMYGGRFVWIRGKEVWQARQNHLLVQAIADHHSSLALAALAEGADANARTVLGHEPFTLLEIIKAIFKPPTQPSKSSPSAIATAVHENDTVVAHYLIAHGAHVESEWEGLPGTTLLEEAIKNNNTTIVNDLLAHRGRLRLMTTFHGSPLVIEAFKKKNFAIVYNLLAHGADPDERDSDENSLIDLASEQGYLYLVREIFAGGYRLPKDGGATSCLALAAGAGHYDVVRYLLSRGALLDNASDTEAAQTPLRAAATNGYTKIVRLLLNRGAKVDTDHEGGTALRLAVENGHLDTVKILVAFGAEACPTRSDQQGIPLTCATGPNRMEIVKVLVRAGADVNYEGESRRRPKTPLYEAVMSNDVDYTRYLLVHGADVDKRTGWQFTSPLIYASAYGYTEVVKVLLEFGAKVNIATENMDSDTNETITALSIARQNGHKDIIKLLKRAGARK